MNNVEVDPTLINKAWSQKLAQANEEVVLLQAAATQFQQQNEQLIAETASLKARVQELEGQVVAFEQEAAGREHHEAEKAAVRKR